MWLAYAIRLTILSDFWAMNRQFYVVAIELPVKHFTIRDSKDLNIFHINCSKVLFKIQFPVL